MDRILILGYGKVGERFAKEIAPLHPDVYDKFKPGVNTEDPSVEYDLAVICVDTPRTDGSPCLLTGVVDCLASHKARLYMIKSTVLPGTTEDLARKTGKRIVFSPEYYGFTIHSADEPFDFTVIGGDKADCVEAQRILQPAYRASHRFRLTDARTAELAKYMENAWLATKVSFCCEFFDVAEGMGVPYEDLREIFIMDPRVNPSHTFVYRDHPYWESHCLDKDVPAIAETCDMELLKSVVKFNEKRKPDRAGGRIGNAKKPQ